MDVKTVNLTFVQDPTTSHFIVRFAEGEEIDLIEHLAQVGEQNRLAHILAVIAVESILNGMTIEQEIDGERWRSLDDEWDFHPFRENFADEVRYAELRGMLRHHPTRPELVQLVDPSAPSEIGGR
jgi:hypothetical protein